MKKLYIGNLPFSTTQDQLKELFTQYGEISEVVIVTDRHTGRSRGFGFVSLADDEAAGRAITEMNGKDMEGRAIVVNEAKPMGDRSEGGGFRRRPFNRRRGGFDRGGDDF